MPNEGPSSKDDDLDRYGAFNTTVVSNPTDALVELKQARRENWRNGL